MLDFYILCSILSVHLCHANRMLNIAFGKSPLHLNVVLYKKKCLYSCPMFVSLQIWILHHLQQMHPSQPHCPKVSHISFRFWSFHYLLYLQYYNYFVITQVARGAVTLTKMNAGGNNSSRTVLIGLDGRGQHHQSSPGRPKTTPQEVRTNFVCN